MDDMQKELKRRTESLTKSKADRVRVSVQEIVDTLGIDPGFGVSISVYRNGSISISFSINFGG